MNKESQKKIDLIMATYREEGPLMVRRIYYKLLSAGFYDSGKSANPKHNWYVYQNLSQRLVEWRENGILDPAVIIDEKSRVIEAQTWKSVDACVYYALNHYIKDDFLKKRERMVEVWIEKDTMTGLFQQICLEAFTPLVVSKGITSWTYKDQACKRFRNYRKPVMILYLGDFDAYGQHIPAVLERHIRKNAPEVELTFEKVALTADDFDRLRQYAVKYEPEKKDLEHVHVKEFIERYGKFKLEFESLSQNEARTRLIDALNLVIDLSSVKTAWKQADRETKQWRKEHLL